MASRIAYSEERLSAETPYIFFSTLLLGFSSDFELEGKEKLYQNIFGTSRK